MSSTQVRRKPKDSPALKTFRTEVEEATRYLCEEQLFKINPDGMYAYKWDRYIRMILDALVREGSYKTMFSTPIDAMEDLVTVLFDVQEKHIPQISQKLMVRVRSDIELRDKYKTAKSAVVRSQAAKELRNRGLLK